MKRGIVAVLICALTVGMCVGCGDAKEDTSKKAETQTEKKEEKKELEKEVKKEGSGETIVVQVWGGTYEETMREYAIPIFEKKTGAKVEVVTGAAPLSQLATEGEEASIDILNLDETEVINGEKMGIYETLDQSKLENSKDLYKQAFKYNSAVISNWGSYGICYRTDLVKTPPTSWLDLWSDEFKDGKLGFYDYTMGGGLETLDILSRIDGTQLSDESNWDKLFGELSKLKPSIGLFISANEDALTMLENGDIIASTLTNGQSLKLKEAGVPIDYVMPKEGIPAMTSFAGITKGSTHKELAYQFLDILLSKEVQKAYAEQNYYGPSNSKTEVDEKIKAFMPYGEEEISNLIYLDTVALEPKKEKLVERWEQELK